jgi:hypothetical protein
MAIYLWLYGQSCYLLDLMSVRDHERDYGGQIVGYDLDGCSLFVMGLY